MITLQTKDHAAVKGKVDILELLLSRGADLNAVKRESRIEESEVKNPPKDRFFTNTRSDLEETALDIAPRIPNAQAAVKLLEDRGGMRYCFHRQ